MHEHSESGVRNVDVLSCTRTASGALSGGSLQYCTITTVSTEPFSRYFRLFHLSEVWITLGSTGLFPITQVSCL